MSGKACHVAVTSIKDLTEKVFLVVPQGIQICASGKPVALLTKGLASKLRLFRSLQISLHHTRLSLSTLNLTFVDGVCVHTMHLYSGWLECLALLSL
jgi:hypothetical protein